MRRTERTVDGSLSSSGTLCCMLAVCPPVPGHESGTSLSLGCQASSALCLELASGLGSVCESCLCRVHGGTQRAPRGPLAWSRSFLGHSSCQCSSLYSPGVRRGSRTRVGTGENGRIVLLVRPFGLWALHNCNIYVLKCAVQWVWHSLTLYDHLHDLVPDFSSFPVQSPSPLTSLPRCFSSQIEICCRSVWCCPFWIFHFNGI